MIREYSRLTDRRAVSTTLGYALTLGITTLLITGLLLASGGFVEDKREEAIRSELRVIGQQTAADIQAGDRLAQASESEFTLGRDLPDTVSGSAYYIEVEVGPDPTDTYLRLTTDKPAVTIEIDMVLHKPISETTVQGGSLRVTFDPIADELVVKNG